MIRKIAAALLLGIAPSVFADDLPVDTIAAPDATPAADTIAPAPTKFYERGIIGKVYNYFRESNREHPDKRFDMSFIGGPHFSSEEGFGLGVAGSGLYRAGNFENRSTPLSNVTLKLDVTTGQMYKIACEGYHIFEGDRHRINYDVYFYSFVDKWWGIGYAQNSVDSNECKYKRLQSQATVDYVFKFGRGLFVGPIAQFSYVNARDFRKPELLGDRRDRVFALGAGLTFYLDTRDIPTAATRGVYLRLNAMGHPSWLANKEPFTLVEATASFYKTVWSGGVLAMNAHTRLTWGDTPWCLLSTFGGNTMRGYWEGRYRDRKEADITVELRQHVWRRNGIAVWVGAGEVFPRFSAFTMRHVLPNFGVGYRWEFKKGVNVRLDVGFGKGEKGFNFSLNEAF